VNILHYTMVYATSINAPDLSLAEVLILSLMFSQALFMPLLSFKFSKAANLFETLIFAQHNSVIIVYLLPIFP